MDPAPRGRRRGLGVVRIPGRKRRAASLLWKDFAGSLSLPRSTQRVRWRASLPARPAAAPWAPPPRRQLPPGCGQLSAQLSAGKGKAERGVQADPRRSLPPRKARSPAHQASAAPCSAGPATLGIPRCPPAPCSPARCLCFHCSATAPPRPRSACAPAFRADYKSRQPSRPSR
jgi:hypothetical protein